MVDQDPHHDEFVRLLAANATRLQSFIRALVLNDPNDAEEVFQNVCMTLWRKFPEFDASGDFGAWACRMAHFVVLQERDRRRRIRHLSEKALESLAEAAAPVAKEVNERRELLRECMKRLPEADFQLLESRYFEGLRPKQIAERTSRSLHAVYRQLRRVHSVLLRCVESKLVQRTDR